MKKPKTHLVRRALVQSQVSLLFLTYEGLCAAWKGVKHATAFTKKVAEREAAKHRRKGINAKAVPIPTARIAYERIAYDPTSVEITLYQTAPSAPPVADTFDLALRVSPLAVLYRKLRDELLTLPATRMRSLALTDLESSFSRAVFAVSGLENPIGGPPA